MSTVRRGLFYGAIGFAIGFVLGTLRELVLIPAFGDQVGRYVEFPIVVIGVVIAARWLFGETSSGAWPARLFAGAIGVVVLVALESGLALGVLRMPLETYAQGYDVSRGALFPIGLLIMLVAPVVVAMKRG
jgi:hypothetical protein